MRGMPFLGRCHRRISAFITSTAALGIFVPGPNTSKQPACLRKSKSLGGITPPVTTTNYWSSLLTQIMRAFNGNKDAMDLAIGPEMLEHTTGVWRPLLIG